MSYRPRNQFEPEMEGPQGFVAHGRTVGPSSPVGVTGGQSACRRGGEGLGVMEGGSRISYRPCNFPSAFLVLAKV